VPVQSEFDFVTGRSLLMASVGVGQLSYPYPWRGVVVERILSVGALSRPHPVPFDRAAPRAGLTHGGAGLHCANFCNDCRYLPADLETAWNGRPKELAFEATFPQLQQPKPCVVDGATPELADDAARRELLTLREGDLFQTCMADGGPFFEREGLLLLPLDDVEAATSASCRAAPSWCGLTGRIRELRGAWLSLPTWCKGLKQGEVGLQDIEPTLTAFSKTFEDAVAGRRPSFLADVLFHR